MDFQEPSTYLVGGGKKVWRHRRRQPLPFMEASVPSSKKSLVTVGVVVVMVPEQNQRREFDAFEKLIASSARVMIE
ncbi:hypothetical protein L6452_13835 [Arctium lappa]|uniref:Uncharacterized protein n=1 Tax=Arctium lappa TaxID=4217 RepID=A0ACB9CJQ8_ARCLA|nr:hypothetical protein L6452_13835 [Arctium lappa]